MERVSVRPNAALGDAEFLYLAGDGLPDLVVLDGPGAGLYALATSGAFSRGAKGVMDQAKTRASELPDDLMGRLRQTTQKPSESGAKSTGTARRGRQQTKARASGTQRKAARV
jgi:hypothetical protein